MTLRNLAQIAICIGILSVFWLAAIQLAPFASASPANQAAATPQPPAATATPDSAGEQTYTVQSGDTLWSIAVKFYGNGSKYPLILRANNMADNATLSVGVTLAIPSATDSAPVVQPKTSVPPSATPTKVSAAPLQPIPGGQVATPAALPSPTALAAEAPPLSETPKNGAATPITTYLSLLVDVLSAICLLGSLTCAFLSIDAYRHSKRFVQRDYIRKRIRVKV
ncbi:MAG TPA: LysM peptidoglycan-binding domain-containing protein [Anaerolineae bacterium]